MSGSGGGGFGGGFGDGPSCDDLVIDTQISSPRAKVVSTLNVNDHLDVAVDQQSGVKVVVLIRSGAIAGGIASPDVQRLRECLEAGTAYSARVTRINGAQISVRIVAIP